MAAGQARGGRGGDLREDVRVEGLHLLRRWHRRRLGPRRTTPNSSPWRRRRRSPPGRPPHDPQPAAGKGVRGLEPERGRKTTAAPYTLRARAEPTVSAPVTWQEVADCASPDSLVFRAPDIAPASRRTATCWPRSSTPQAPPGCPDRSHPGPDVPVPRHRVQRLHVRGLSRPPSAARPGRSVSARILIPAANGRLQTGRFHQDQDRTDLGGQRVRRPGRVGAHPAQQRPCVAAAHRHHRSATRTRCLRASSERTAKRPPGPITRWWMRSRRAAVECSVRQPPPSSRSRRHRSAVRPPAPCVVDRCAAGARRSGPGPGR